MTTNWYTKFRIRAMNQYLFSMRSTFTNLGRYSSSLISYRSMILIQRSHSPTRRYFWRGPIHKLYLRMKIWKVFQLLWVAVLVRLFMGKALHWGGFLMFSLRRFKGLSLYTRRLALSTTGSALSLQTSFRELSVSIARICMRKLCKMKKCMLFTA